MRNTLLPQFENRVLFWSGYSLRRILRPPVTPLACYPLWGGIVGLISLFLSFDVLFDGGGIECGEIKHNTAFGVLGDI